MAVMSTPPFEAVRTVLKTTSRNFRDNRDYKDTPGNNAGTRGTALHTTMKRRMSPARLAMQSEDRLVVRKG
jgi:hypothetical protein